MGFLSASTLAYLGLETRLGGGALLNEFPTRRDMLDWWIQGCQDLRKVF